LINICVVCLAIRWIATTGSITIVDPRGIAENARPPGLFEKKNGLDLDRSVSPSGSANSVVNDIHGADARAEFVAPRKKTGAPAPSCFWVYCFCPLASASIAFRKLHARTGTISHWKHKTL